MSQARAPGGWRLAGPALVIGAALLWALAETRDAMPPFAGAGAELLGRLYPPDAAALLPALDAALESVRIALLGTAAAAAVAALLSPFAAASLTHPAVHLPVRGVLVLLRAVPLLLSALILVAILGRGPLPGILAIAIHGAGILGRLYAEAIEAVDPAPSAALASAGATPLQRLRFAVWPQMLPAFLRGTADRFERYLRAALILGIVGAGGTGALVEASLREGAPERLATLVLVVVGLVILLELAGARLRRALG